MSNDRETIQGLEKLIQDMVSVYPAFPPPWFTAKLNEAIKALKEARQRLAIREEALEEAAKWCEDEYQKSMNPWLIGYAAAIRGLK